MLKKIKPIVLFFTLIVFFISVTIVLILINYIVFLAATNIFTIPYLKYVSLGVFLMMFSACFMLMLLIERYYSNKIIRFLYIFSAVWMGMLVYFFIASLIYIVVNLFIYIPSMIGIILFICAVVVSIYGFINGKKLVVKKIQVVIPGLPEKWKNKKIVWMSDLHLGPIRGAKFAEKVVKISNSLLPSMVFIGGDLYDGSHTPDPYLIAKPLGNLFAEQGVFFITGNHEEFRDPSIFLSAVQKLGIKILDDSKIEIDGLQIIGVDYLNSANKKRFKNVLENIEINKNIPSILLKHEPSDLEISQDAGISFQISGHTHNGQQWPFNYLTKLMYKGFNYGLKYYGSMPVYVSSGTGGWGPSLRIGSSCEIVYIEFI